MEKKPIAFSGIQPTGVITIGNYIGAIKNWLALQDVYDTVYSIVDLHSLTVRQVPSELRKRSLSFFAQYLACGLNPDKSIIYYQSQVPEHCELTWILNCFTYIGEMSRMTQFKEKSAKHADNINMGLMDYPVLMAADILLYQTNVVPIGIDQKQHVEIARDIALRFNNLYSETFAIPEPLTPTQGAKITSLQNPTAKMSKSDPDENGYIALIDSPETILRKIKRAVTDSENCVEFRAASETLPAKDGINNLLTIYSEFDGRSIQDIAKEYQTLGYGKFKDDLAETVIEKLRPIRDKYNDLLNNKDYLTKIAKEGAEKARYIAQKTLRKVHKKIGLIEK